MLARRIPGNNPIASWLYKKLKNFFVYPLSIPGPCVESPYRAAINDRPETNEATVRVSFFDYDDSIQGYRYITLDADTPSLDTEAGGATDEGYSKTWQSWILDLDNSVVRYIRENASRDCDGRTSYHNEFTCALHELQSREGWDIDGEKLPFLLPEWKEVRRR